MLWQGLVAHGCSQWAGGLTHGLAGGTAVEWFRLEDTSGGLWATTQQGRVNFQAMVASLRSCSTIYRKLINTKQGFPPLLFFPSLLSCKLYE